jgi:DNA-binding transcriptional LysR family regulator
MDKLLSQFLAVADAGTLSGAASTLLVTQPTLTFNMKKLEETIGAPLFERSSRGVRLTRYGETLYENARLMQRLYDNTLTAIAGQQRGSDRGLAVGSGYSWWTMFLKDMVVEYQLEFPNAPVQVSLGNQLRLPCSARRAARPRSPPIPRSSVHSQKAGTNASSTPRAAAPASKPSSTAPISLSAPIPSPPASIMPSPPMRSLDTRT